MKKKIIIILIIVLFMCLGSFVVFNLAKKDNNKDKEVDISSEGTGNDDGDMTVSSDIIIDLLDNMEKDEYKVKDLTFKDVKAYVGDGGNSFEATVSCENARSKLNFEFVLYDEDGKEIDVLEFELLEIEENDERNLFCFVDTNLISAYSFVVRVK